MTEDTSEAQDPVVHAAQVTLANDALALAATGQLSEATQATVDTRVNQYVQIRDRLKEMDEEFEKKKAPLVEIQNLLTGWMMQFLEKTGAESVKTAHGTCYASTRYTASLADPDAFMQYVISHGKFELLDRRANTTAVKDFVADNKVLPPGCNLNAMRTIGVRRSSKK